MAAPDTEALESWTCGCGHSHRYDPALPDSVELLRVSCRGCHQSSVLRAGRSRPQLSLR